MFKGRLGLWAILIIVCFICQWLIGVVPTWFHSNELTASISVDADRDLGQVLNNNKFNHLKYIVTTANPEVVITDNVDEIPGYTKHEDYLYSPLIAYACNVYYDSDGFIAVPGTSNCYKLDLYNVLTAIEQDKTWQDLGVHKDTANGAVTLYIPNERNAYYNEVVELFYLTLNGGKAPDDSTKASLQTRVDGLLNKCHKVTDVCQAIVAEYDNPSEEHKIFIGPEYLYERGQGYSIGPGNDNSKQYRTIYFMNTVYITADVFIKDAEADSIGSAFLERIQSKKHFMQNTGWRVQNSTFNLDDVSYTLYETP